MVPVMRRPGTQGGIKSQGEDWRKLARGVKRELGSEPPTLQVLAGNKRVVDRRITGQAR